MNAWIAIAQNFYGNSTALIIHSLLDLYGISIALANHSLDPSLSTQLIVRYSVSLSIHPLDPAFFSNRYSEMICYGASIQATC